MVIEDREREEAGHRATPSRKKRERADSPTSNPNSTYPRLNKKNREKTISTKNIHKKISTKYPEIDKKWIKKS